MKKFVQERSMRFEEARKELACIELDKLWVQYNQLSMYNRETVKDFIGSLIEDRKAKERRRDSNSSK